MCVCVYSTIKSNNNKTNDSDFHISDPLDGQYHHNWSLLNSTSSIAVLSHVIYIYRFIDLVGWVFANGPGDLGSVPGRVIPETLKMVLDTSLLNTQHYKVRIKGKVEQSRERSSAPLYLSVVAIEKGANFTYFYIHYSDVMTLWILLTSSRLHLVFTQY